MSNRLVLLSLATVVLGFTISAAHAGNPCREAARTGSVDAVKACYHSKRSTPHGTVDRSIGYAIAKGDCRRFKDRDEAFEICRIGRGTVGFDDPNATVLPIETYEMARLPVAQCQARYDETESFSDFISTVVPFDEFTTKSVCDAFESEGKRRTSVNDVHCQIGGKTLYIQRCGF